MSAACGRLQPLLAINAVILTADACGAGRRKCDVSGASSIPMLAEGLVRVFRLSGGQPRSCPESLRNVGGTKRNGGTG